MKSIIFTFVLFPFLVVGGADQLFSIKNKKSGLALDGSELLTKVQNFTNELTQLWKKKGADSTSYYIVNANSGKVLTPTDLKNEAKVETQPLTESNKQKWLINEDGTIINVAANRALDVFYDKLTPGQMLIIYDTHRRENQLWEISLPPKSSPTQQATLPSKQNTLKPFAEESPKKPLKNKCVKKRIID